MGAFPETRRGEQVYAYREGREESVPRRTRHRTVCEFMGISRSQRRAIENYGICVNCFDLSKNTDFLSLHFK